MTSHFTTILRCEVGSTAHGTGLPGKEDLDEMAIGVPKPEYVTGLNHWEQDILRLDNGRNLGPHERSTPDTYELTTYNIRKWTRLAQDGNPSTLMLLWAPIREIRMYGTELRDHLTDKIVSRKALPRYAGYMRSQALRLMGLKGSGHGARGGGRREELIDEFGFDTKYAMHMVRLGEQGLELALTGRNELPIPGEVGEYLRALRRGEVSADDAIRRAISLYEQILDPNLETVLRPTPDRAAINRWLHQAHMWEWASEAGKV